MDVLLQKINFSYGNNKILYDVDLEIKGGEIQALLGENGAGKSTLMNLLGGIIHTADGKIYIDGKQINFKKPSDSLAIGIGFIHQELNLINDLTVYENMFIPNYPKKGLFIDKTEMIKRTEGLFSQLNIDIDPCSYVRDLDVSYKQITEICKVLMQNAKVIIMDEPTTSLTDTEIKRIFGIMRMLKEKGVAIVFISHKLNEVVEICDTYSVMRDGRLVDKGNIRDVTVKELSEKLVGHSVCTESFVPNCKTGEEVLHLENFSDNIAFENINLSVKSGEILGVTGLMGDGRSEIFQTVFGIRKAKYTGSITYCNKPYIPKNTEKAKKIGMAYVPNNRNENGIIPDSSVIDNSTIVALAQFRKYFFIDNKRTEKEVSVQKDNLNIKMKSENDSITSLSGGNQQKVVFSKWIINKPKLFVLDNPAQGVDVGAKTEIYGIIRKTAEDGAAIIILSPEAQEIKRLCNKVIVLFHGKINAVLEGEDITESNIMYFATGSNINISKKNERESPNDET